MPKYAILGGYTAETWARFIDNPSDRTDAVNRAAQAVGGTVDNLYVTFGEDDFLVIAECPNDEAAAAISIAVGASGSLRNLRTIKLIDARELPAILAKAKSVVGAYVPPGAREPARV